MKVFARCKPEENRILEYVRIEDDEALLPFEATMDEIAEGENAVLGAAVIRIEKSRVVEHRPAVRALRGLVAVLGADGNIRRTVDLGPNLVPVADSVFPFEETIPVFDEATQVLGEPAVEHAKDGTVRRIFSVRDKTAPEIAEEAARRDKEDIEAAFGSIGADILFEQENRLNQIGRQEPISREEFERRALEKFRARK